MVKKRYSILIKGKELTWSFTVDALPQWVEDWRGDGLVVSEIMNTIPEWAVYMGLTKPWCLVQDIFNFRWRNQ